MKIERLISKYNNVDDSLIADYQIDHVPLAKLKEIFNVGSSDPEVLKVYKINKDQLIKMIEFVPDLVEENDALVSTDFFYECFVSN